MVIFVHHIHTRLVGPFWGGYIVPAWLSCLAPSFHIVAKVRFTPLAKTFRGKPRVRGSAAKPTWRQTAVQTVLAAYTAHGWPNLSPRLCARPAAARRPNLPPQHSPGPGLFFFSQSPRRCARRDVFFPLPLGAAAPGRTQCQPPATCRTPKCAQLQLPPKCPKSRPAIPHASRRCARKTSVGGGGGGDLREKKNQSPKKKHGGRTAPFLPAQTQGYRRPQIAKLHTEIYFCLCVLGNFQK